jgi:16S rRNA (guanine527-N7)-methyltransferase
LKRVSFLRHIVRTLGLAQVTIEPKRLEDIDAATLQYTCITSRAVAEIDEFLQMVAHLAGPQVDIICMKGPKWQMELDHAKACLQRRHFMLRRVEEFELPFSAAQRALLFFQKTCD